MGTFDGFNDVTGQLKREGETITLTFSPGLPVTGQGTVQWNIPAPAQGCQTDDGRGVYCGIVILLSTHPLTAAQVPVDGTFYTNDPTANPDLHVGDSIADALVVGAFYEGEKRSRDEDLSTSLIISDLETNGTYYVAGYAVDCQGRYHKDGVRGYSDEYGNTDQPSVPAFQEIQMNAGEGVLGTDGTNLIPGAIYEFDIEVNENFPHPSHLSDVINVKIDGIDAQTYDELVDAINNQLAISENPPQSPVPPNTGSYLYDLPTMQLAQFNGATYDLLDSLFEPTDPSVVGMGAYWYDPSNDILQRWNIPSPTGWNLVSTIKYHEDPISPQCDDYWWTGADAYLWNGSTWCETTTLISATDPGCPIEIDCGTFWYDETNMTMFEWNINQQNWIERTAIFWPEAPNALSNGTYWFDLETEFVYLRSAGAWAPQTTAIIFETQPTGVLPNGQLWYNPATEELKEWDDVSLVFNDLAVLVWAGDPTIVGSCDLWWNSTSNILFTWDVVTVEWDQVATFIESPTDPQQPPIIAVDTLWYDTVNVLLFRWDGGAWLPVTFIDFPTDPTAPPVGTAWLNTTTGVWSVRDTPAPGWNVINPIDIDTDPNTIPAGTFWYDSTNNILFQRVGVAWVAIPFTTLPVTPSKGDKYFDLSADTLLEWDGSAWVESAPKLTVFLNGNRNLVFISRLTGSCACVMTLVPGQYDYGSGTDTGTGYADFHSFGHFNSYVDSPFKAPPLRLTEVTAEGFLFNNLPAQILPQVYGADGLDGEPMYDIVGVGNDGTPDERRELAESVRAQLGYPVVDVELTPYQLDEAIQGGIESLRKRGEIAYKRGWFMLDVRPGQQIYRLTNKKAGFNKIVTIMSCHRFTSAFLSSAHGAGVYGQVVLQHLYNMGTYDLTSFHLVAQYIEQLEHLFATRMTFNWDEDERLLHLHQSMVRPERILMDCAVERTEQQLLKDRWCKTWIEKYALSQSRYMLAEIRGKFGSLPGAGGGVSLNAADLITRADQDMQDLYQQLDDFVASRVEDWGMGTTFVIG